MNIVNPFLTLIDFRFSKRSKYQHNGQFVRLGVGQSLSGAGWLSPVEANYDNSFMELI